MLKLLIFDLVVCMMDVVLNFSMWGCESVLVFLCSLMLMGLIEMVWILMSRLCGFGFGIGRLMLMKYLGLEIGRGLVMVMVCMFFMILW